MKDINILKDGGVNVEQGLEILGDMEMYDETLNDFLDESESRLTKIEEFKNNGDMANYAILVHAMKSDSKYLGFTILAQLSFDHEMKSKENNIEYVNEHYNDLMAEANRIVTLVKKYLKKD